MKSDSEPGTSPAASAPVRCHVYRSSVRDGLYVYVAVPDGTAADEASAPADGGPGGSPADDPVTGGPASGDPALESLPAPVRRQLGRPVLAMTLDLHENRRLGQEDVREVLANLAGRGFHVQMPRDIEPLVAAVADAAVSNAAERRASAEAGKDRPGKTEDSGRD